MYFRLPISLILLTILSLPAQAVPTASQIKYVAQRICQLPEPEIPEGADIKPGTTEYFSHPEATAIYYQEMGKLLDNGSVLPVDFVNDDVMEPIKNRLVQEIYAKCQRKMTWTNDSDSE